MDHILFTHARHSRSYFWFESEQASSFKRKRYITRGLNFLQNHSFSDFTLLTHYVNHCDTFHCKQSLTHLSNFSRVSVSVRQRQVSFLTASSQSPQRPVVIKMLSLGNSGRTATWSRYSVHNKLHPLMPASLLHWQDAKVQPLTNYLFYFQLKYTWANSAEQKCKTKRTSNLVMPPSC